jgi:arylsulfatase A-like enzyme
MNVLFISVDDLRPELGCYGSTAADTPHMDAFAATALRFDRHFVQAPSCGPSRYALLTGRSPASSGALGNGALYSGKTQLIPERQAGAQSLPEAFRRGGYRTVCIGKISHTPDGRVYGYDGKGDGRHELPHAWDELATPFGPWKRGWGAFFAYEGGAHREDGEGHSDLMQFTAEKDTDLPDGLMARAAADKLKELKDANAPFFLGVGFFKPHLPFVATRGDWEAMSEVDVEAPDALTEFSVPSAHASGEFKRYASEIFAGPEPRLPLTDAEAITARRAYLACIRYVDRQVGVVLDALESEGLADSTIVVLWGDHGWHLGESGVWGKHTVLDRSLRSVLVIRAPGVTKKGTVTRSLAATIDLAPTLLALTGQADRAMASPLDGLDLTAVLRDPSRAPRESVSAYYGRLGTLRTDRYRLIARRGKDGWTEPRVFDCATSQDPAQATETTDPKIIQDLVLRLRH